VSKFSVLFPAFCDALREPDPQFQREASALDALGIPLQVVDVASLESGDLEEALRYFEGGGPSPVVYRGFILHPQEYAGLYQALSKRGYRMLTTPQEYCHAHLFPEFFPAIADHSIPATWIAGQDVAAAAEAARRVGQGPYFIKDYSKSAKLIWPEGCLANSERELPEAIAALVKYRGSRFEGGIVIRPFVRLRLLGESPFGGPTFEEYRLFFFRGKQISRTAYDHVGGDPSSIPDFSFLAERIKSPFFSADVVVSEEGRTYVLEVGDGGTSGLPPRVSPIDFYTAISASFADGTKQA